MVIELEHLNFKMYPEYSKKSIWQCFHLIIYVSIYILYSENDIFLENFIFRQN